MKRFYLYLFITCTLFLNSCSTMAQISFDDYGYTTNVVTYTHVVEYGTPYYVNNVLMYYYYNNMYYYPYIWNGHHYFRPYRHVQPRGFVYHPSHYHRPDRAFRGPVEHHSHNYSVGRDRNYRIPSSTYRTVPHTSSRQYSTPRYDNNSHQRSNTTIGNGSHIGSNNSSRGGRR